MAARLRLVWPAREYLAGYVDALNRGWSPDNLRGDVARRHELQAIADDVDAFLTGLVDREARGGPIELLDGTRVPRLPGYRRWMWTDGFVGTIGFRWQPGTSELPAHVPGHIGYAVVPWHRGRGHATEALRLLLPEAKAERLEHVDLTVEPTNLASRRVIEANGGVLLREIVVPPALGHSHRLVYRIVL